MKSEGGQIQSQKPAAPPEETKPPEENATPGQPERKTAEAPPGPKEQPEPVEAPRAEKALQDIYFDFDSYVIGPKYTTVLIDNAEWLKAHPNAVVTIEGNCDERGTVEYNLALGEKRADAAKNYLVSLGVSADRMKTISYGKSKPVDPGHDEAAWAKNRRDHFVVQ
ncbi:MAG: peptidoglycan-associated lipoprotein Pal [Nitrospirota bacterium]